MEKNISVDVIERYLSGNCTPDEIKEVYQWFRSFDNTPESIAGLPADEKDLAKKRLFAQIISEINKDNNVVPLNSAGGQQLNDNTGRTEHYMNAGLSLLWRLPGARICSVGKM